MDQTYKSVIEALIFASDDPVKSVELIKAIKEIDGEDTEITTIDVENAVAELNIVYKQNDSSFSILKIANGFIFATGMEYAKYLGYLSNEKSKRRLSQAALETLAIVAYKQPITKPEIEMIRGVNSDYMINTLLEKNLINIQGRSETIGRPLLYGTTDEFLKYFGINNISDLPKPREIEEIMKDEDFQEQKRKILMNALEESIAPDEEENNDE
ncbi:MAG: segregation and condensation protein B [Melioribacteraceae bacterium]|nr:MAG: segregation and condensation protein B [Melioribacteraceae bacterium]